jgi:hypothetical protein
MFILRLKHNKGYTYIQVVDESSGKYKVLKILVLSKQLNRKKS